MWPLLLRPTLDTATDYTLFTSANTITDAVTNAPVWVGTPPTGAASKHHYQRRRR